MDNNQQPTSNTAQTPIRAPAPPTETPSSQLNATSPPLPQSPQSNEPSNTTVQNAVKTTLQPQSIEQPSQYQPITNHQSPTTNHQLPITSKGFTQKEVKSFTWRAFAKTVYIIIFIIGSLGGVFFVSKKTVLKPKAGITGDILLQAPYQPVLWKDFGEVFEPMIKMPLYYPSEGFVKHKFLLDSGALVSSLPREEAKKMGLSLAKLPRSTFGGFGGTTSFAYKAEAKIKLGEKEVKIPIVFTETEGTKSILGRSGFFEKYSIYFNSKREMIEIRK